MSSPGPVPVRTTYSIDFQRKTAHPSASVVAGISAKPFRANFRVGNGGLPTDFTSAATHFQRQCLDLAASDPPQRHFEFCPRQALTVGCRTGQPPSFSTCHREAFSAKCGSESFELAKPAKIRALNVFESAPGHRDDRLTTEYQTGFAEDLKKRSEDSALETQPRFRKAEQATASHILFQGNSCPFVSATKEAFAASAIKGAEALPALGRPSRGQAFSIADNKYKALNVKANRFKNDFSHIEVVVPTAAELRERSLAKQHPFGFSDTSYASQCHRTFAVPPSDSNETQPAGRAVLDKRLGGASLGLRPMSNAPLCRTSLYQENFPGHQVLPTSKADVRTFHHRGHVVVGTAKSEWKSTFQN